MEQLEQSNKVAIALHLEERPLTNSALHVGMHFQLSRHLFCWHMGRNRLVTALEQWCWKLVIDNNEMFAHMLFMVKKQSSFMASFGYAALVGGHCGCSAGNPANSQCVTIAHCNKDIQDHLRSFGAGLADSSIKNGAELLLSRAGKKKSVMYLFFPLCTKLG